MRKRAMVVILILVVLFVLSGCLPGNGSNTPDHPAGIFAGIWHGWIAPFSLVISIFNHDISIYEAYNVGFWYNLGYYMAIISGIGGLSLSRRKGCGRKD